MSIGTECEGLKPAAVFSTFLLVTCGFRWKGSVLNSGARLYEPQHIPMQSKPLRVADPRSENKSGDYPWNPKSSPAI